MSNKNLRNFKEQARNVGFAHKNTQRQYDEYPPKTDMVSNAEAINAWTLVCGCYMGIEQTMKLLIRMRGREPNMGHSGHDLVEGYGQLDPSDRRLVSDYHGVYRSLHNFNTGDISIETADEFIRHMGNGYVAWRYILTEDNKRMPKVHLGMMLETWRALADLVQHSISDDKYPFQTVADFLEGYIIKEVFHDAEMDEEWQAASQDEKQRCRVHRNPRLVLQGKAPFGGWDRTLHPPFAGDRRFHRSLTAVAPGAAPGGGQGGAGSAQSPSDLQVGGHRYVPPPNQQ